MNLAVLHSSQQVFRKGIHPLRRHPDDRLVLVARSRQVKLAFAAKRMRRCVPRTAAQLPPLQDVFPLFVSHSPPRVHVGSSGFSPRLGLGVLVFNEAA